MEDGSTERVADGLGGDGGEEVTMADVSSRETGDCMVLGGIMMPPGKGRERKGESCIHSFLPPFFTPPPPNVTVPYTDCCYRWRVEQRKGDGELLFGTYFKTFQVH